GAAGRWGTRAQGGCGGVAHARPPGPGGGPRGPGPAPPRGPTVRPRPAAANRKRPRGEALFVMPMTAAAWTASKSAKLWETTKAAAPGRRRDAPPTPQAPYPRADPGRSPGSARGYI